jgi:predicted nuclease of predicted toxin-antitoxin system
MRFLADESCDFAVVRTLRASGHDVLAVSEFQQRSIDQELMHTAYREDRILLTEDKDFGWLTIRCSRQNRRRGVDPLSGVRASEASSGHCQAGH